MKNSAIKALFAEQYDVPRENIKVEFIRYVDSSYQFEVTIDKGNEVERLTYYSKCSDFTYTEIEE